MCVEEQLMQRYALLSALCHFIIYHLVGLMVKYTYIFPTKSLKVCFTLMEGL